MVGKLRIFFAWFLLIIFLLPISIKAGHHHLHHEIKAGNGISLVAFHEKCAICQFEFATFLTDTIQGQEEPVTPAGSPVIAYCPVVFPVKSILPFQLRGPPQVTI